MKILVKILKFACLGWTKDHLKLAVISTRRSMHQHQTFNKTIYCFSRCLHRSLILPPSPWPIAFQFEPWPRRGSPPAKARRNHSYFSIPWSRLQQQDPRRTMEFATRHCSINEINVRISLSNIYIFIMCLHINKAYTKLMQETLNLKKGLNNIKQQDKNLHMSTK